MAFLHIAMHFGIMCAPEVEGKIEALGSLYSRLRPQEVAKKMQEVVRSAPDLKERFQNELKLLGPLMPGFLTCRHP